MAINAIDHLLEELSTLLKGKLVANPQSSCLFKFDGALVQIEIDKTGNHVLLVAQLGTVPMGRYRETLFQEALKHNGISDTAANGIFAYSKQADSLILYQMMPVATTNGEKIFNILPTFCHTAKTWTEAINRGEVPIGTSATATARGGPLGLFGTIH